MFRTPLVAGGLVLATLLALTAGCDTGPKKVAVSGTVTYDGKPVEYGTISFGPTNGGPTAGGEINDGKYSVKDVTPGKNIVNINSAHKVTGPMSYDSNKMDPAQMSKKGQAAAKQEAKKASREEIPNNAVGNGQFVEITAPTESQNFDLKKPGSK